MIRPELVELALFSERVDDVKRFYALLLRRPADSDWPGGATHASGGVTILVHERGDEIARGPENRDHVAFAVDDVDEACADLRAQGIEIEIGPRDFPWGRSAYLRDPDGRLVELAQR